MSTCKGHTSRVNAVLAMPDGERILSGGSDKTIRVWRINGTRENTFKLHASHVHALVALRNHQHVLDGREQHALSGSADHTIKLFNVNDGTVVRTFTHHTDWVTCLALLPDGLRFVSGSDDGTARIVEIGPVPAPAASSSTAATSSSPPLPPPAADRSKAEGAGGTSGRRRSARPRRCASSCGRRSRSSRARPASTRLPSPARAPTRSLCAIWTLARSRHCRASFGVTRSRREGREEKRAKEKGCQICMANDKNTVLNRAAQVCAACATQIRGHDCPFCKQRFRDTTLLFS